MKIIPRYNDAPLIQHADDQIDDGSEISGEPHEVTGYPIGNAVESYQGFLTCQVFVEAIALDTDGNLPTEVVGSGLIEHIAESQCEAVKVVEIPEVTETTMYHFVFRLRTIEGSANYNDVDQYVLMLKDT